MRDEIWRSMLDAEMNAKYWTALVQKYSTRDRTLKTFLAVMASGTVAGWGIWLAIPTLWKSLSAVSAVLAIIQPILNYQKSIGQMAVIAGKWAELRLEYAELWRQVNKNPNSKLLVASYKEFRKIQSSMHEEETKLPFDKALLKDSFEEVKRVRGLA